MMTVPDQEESVRPLSNDGGAVLVDVEHPPSVTKLLSGDEAVLMAIRPSLWYVGLWSLGSLFFIVGLVFALAWASRFPWATWTEFQAFGLGFLLAGIRLAWQFLDWANRLYVLTDRRVIRRRGVFQVDIFEARLEHIQQSSVLQMVRERIFGLGSIAFATAASAPLFAAWECVQDPIAVQKAVSEAVDRYGRGSGSV